MPLSDLARILRDAGLLLEAHGPEDPRILGVSQDSRRVEPGDLFLAWEGSETDAHQYVAAAVRAGAVGAVVERVVEGVEAPQLEVSDGRLAAAIVADAVNGSPWRRLWLAGVTGTNGKTTTTWIARHLIDGDRPAASLGTLGAYGTGGRPVPGGEGLTTPGPVEVAERLRHFVEAGIEAVVMEASSHALVQRRLDGLRFDAAAFTNLSQDHLDYHESPEEYLLAKAHLADLLVEGGTRVVNGDEAAWRTLPPRGRRTILFGFSDSAEIRAVDLILEAGESRFTLRGFGEEARVRLPLPGRFNVENALAAVGIATAAGVGIGAAAERLAEVPQVPGRLEVVSRDPCTVLIDFAHTPDALARVIEAVRGITPGRLIVLFGAGGDRDRSKRPEMGRVVARGADIAILTSDNPRTEDPERILDDVATGMEEGEFERLVDRREAIGRALEIAAPDDVVLLAGKGHETYQVVGAEKRPFDERAVVREWLAAREGGAR